MQGGWRDEFVILVASVIGGALSGAIVAWGFFEAPYGAFTLPAAPAVAPTSTAPAPSGGVTVIPIDRRKLEADLPSVFLERRPSVANVFAKPQKGSLVLGEDALLGQAAAVTTDGWFVVPADLLEGYAVGDLVLWHDGKAATATAAILDERSSVVFMKADVHGLTAPAFASYQDVTVGQIAWIERRPGSFIQERITSLAAFASNRDGIPSRRSVRRPSLGGTIGPGERGAPVWGSDGRLIGILAGEGAEERRMIPASVLVPSLNDVLAGGSIRHADLGVRSIDLTHMRFLGNADLPPRGAWLQGDRTRSLPAVDPGSPAAQATIRDGDVIVAIDRDILDGTADLGEVLAQYRPGSGVTLTVLREGETLKIPVTLRSDLTMSRSIE
jgi:S1-C subfamily serine protease